MRHAKGYRRLNRTHEHRKALWANMAGSLIEHEQIKTCLLYTSPSPRDRYISRMPSSA